MEHSISSLTQKMRGIVEEYTQDEAALKDDGRYSDDYKQQVGFVVYPAGGEVVRHVHRRLERHIVGTSEVLVIKRGRCEMDVYNDDREPVGTYELKSGDVVIMVAGGHGFRMTEDTVLLEVKQGPYTGEDEKERF